jgi:antitoxin component of MazEF toxin-antitoxin module
VTHAFKAKVDIYDFTKYVYTCVYVPKAILARLPLEEHPRLRINATIDGCACKGALMPDKAGSRQTKHLLATGHIEGERVWYFQVPKTILKAVGKQIGDTVEVTCEVADQDEVDVHPAVAAMLARDAELRRQWEALTAGKKRSLMHPISNARTDVTLEKRLLAFADQLADRDASSRIASARRSTAVRGHTVNGRGGR